MANKIKWVILLLPLLLLISGCNAVTIDKDKLNIEYNAGYAAGYSAGLVRGVATVNMTDKINCAEFLEGFKE